MNKTQWWVLGTMILTAIIAIRAQPGSFAQGFTNLVTPGKAGITGSFIVYWLGGLVVLLILADAVPVVAAMIAGIILLGAVLNEGPAALKGL